MRPAQSHFVGWENADQGLEGRFARVSQPLLFGFRFAFPCRTQVFVGHSLSLEVEPAKNIMICILCERINSDMQIVG